MADGMKEHKSISGTIIKSWHSLTEYWYKDKLILRERNICLDPDPEVRPTHEEWMYCIQKRKENENG